MAASAARPTPQGNAAYGRLSFDQFALDNWDDSRPPSEDQRQWDELAVKFLALLPRQRMVYDDRAGLLQGPSHEGPVELVDAHVVARVFAPHQTVWERNLAATVKGTSDPVLLRTCYLPELEDAWVQVRDNCEISQSLGVEPGHVLDDATLYDFDSGPGGGEGWKAVLNRIPTLVTYGTSGSVEEDFDDYEECLGQRQHVDEDDDETWIEYASTVCTAVVYVVDAEALRDGLLKMKWLDTHGNLVWEYRVTPESLTPLRGGLLQGFSPRDYVGEDGPKRNEVLEL